MRKWNEKEALQVVNNDGFEVVGKMIRRPQGKGKGTQVSGATGLTKLSAIDYLVNHCGYKF